MEISESTLRIAKEIRSEIVFDDDEIDEEEEYVTDEWVTDMDSFDEKFKDILKDHTFKEKMEQDIIPRIWQMAEKEKEHFNWLTANNAPKAMIERSQSYLSHFLQRHKEFIEYAESI